MFLQSMPPASASVPARRTVSPWLAGLTSVLLLGVVGFLDYSTGSRTSFTLLYLLPISTAKWFVGRRAGRIACFVAALIGLSVGLSGDNPSLATELWNAAGRLGIYLVFCALLREARKSDTARIPVIRATQRLVVASAA